MAKSNPNDPTNFSVYRKVKNLFFLAVVSVENGVKKEHFLVPRFLPKSAQIAHCLCRGVEGYKQDEIACNNLFAQKPFQIQENPMQKEAFSRLSNGVKVLVDILGLRYR